MKKIYFLAIALTGMIANAQFWVPQATNMPTNWGVDEISIVDENTVWLTGYDGSGGGTYPKDFARTTDGGVTWVALNAEEFPSTALMSDIAAIDGNTAYIVTAPFSGGPTSNGIWKTTDGGTTWVKYGGSVFTSAASFANHVYFWDANNGYAGGDPVAGKFEMYNTTDGGATWSIINSAPAPQNGDEFTYVGIKQVVGDNIWLGSSLGRILHSTDRGVTWNVYVSPALDFGGVITEGSTASFAFADANNGIMITDDNDFYALYVTSDGGANWTDITPEGTWYGGDIAHVPGTTNTYVSTGINFNLPTGSSYSTDGGLTWIDIDAGEQRGKLAFLNGTTGWCGQFSDGPGGSTGVLKFDGNLNMAVTDVNVKTNLKAYPNPSSSVINFSANKEIALVNLIDTTGKLVMQVKGNSINVSALAPGIYIAQVKYANGGVENTKVVVK